MPERRIAVALTLVCVLGISGCQRLSAMLGGGSAGDSPAFIEPTPAQLSELERLSDGSMQEKVELFAAIDAARLASATDTNRLRYALALSVPGHPSTDLDAAHAELEALLEANNELTLSQRQLATVIFASVEQLLTLQSRNAVLTTSVDRLESSRSASSSAADARLQGVQRRVSELEQDNQRLQAELDEARRQLDAILSIETATDRNN